MQCGRRRCQHGTAHAWITAIPAGDDPARTFHDGDQRLNIVGFQPRFNAQVQRSHGQHSEEVAVAAHFSEFASAAQPLELLLLLRCQPFDSRCRETGSCDIFTQACRQGLTVFRRARAKQQRHHR